MNNARHKICAIIVTYNPDINNVKNLVKQLSDQQTDSIIIDNSPQPLNSFSDENYNWMGGNKGIAAAQNKGIEFVLANKYECTIFFDQDSRIQDGFISALSKPVFQQGLPLCAPAFFDEKHGFEYAITDIKENGQRQKLFSNGSEEHFTTSAAISSGTLVKTALFEKVGVMDDRLFIDYVDTEWCLRCAIKGIRVNIIPSAKMLHSIGDNSIKLMGFRVPIHSPGRRYYRVRNAIHLLRYAHVPKRMALREIVFSCIHSFILIATQPKKMDYIKYFIYALQDGVRNVWGEYNYQK